MRTLAGSTPGLVRLMSGAVSSVDDRGRGLGVHRRRIKSRSRRSGFADAARRESVGVSGWRPRSVPACSMIMARVPRRKSRITRRAPAFLTVTGRSGGIDGRPTSEYIASNVGDNATSASSAKRPIVRNPCLQIDERQRGHVGALFSAHLAYLVSRWVNTTRSGNFTGRTAATQNGHSSSAC